MEQIVLGKVIDLSGYLLSDVKNYTKGDLTEKAKEGDSITYTHNGSIVTINNECNTIKENVYLSGELPELEQYGIGLTGLKQRTMTTRMINGVRYYHPSDAGPPFENMVLAMINGTWHQQNYYSNTERERDPAPKLDVNKVKTKDVDNNVNALEYYRKAALLQEEIRSCGLEQLTPKNACDENGNPLCNDATFGEYFNNDNNIFDFNSSPIEDPDSSFNEHRLNVIKYSVEKNLAVAISNFNTYSTSSTQFEMPRLSEEEWSSIYDNICVISFLQGLSIGGRMYSGHSVIPNTDNKEVVKEDSLRVVDENEGKIYNVTYNKIKYPNIESQNIVNKMALKRSSTEDLDDGHTEYFFRYPNEEVWYAYDSIVTSAGNNSIENGNMYDFIDSCPNDNFRKAYYTALAREREGMYRVENEGFETAYDEEGLDLF